MLLSFKVDLNKIVTGKFFDKYFLSLLLILIVFSTLLRIALLPNQVVFLSDTTRDISISKEALVRHELPFTGSFSSAGPFVFGPAFYWFLMLTYFVAPSFLNAPWVTTLVIGILTVVALGYLGRVAGGARLGFILALLAAASNQLVSISSSPTQHSYVAIFTVLALLFYSLFWKKNGSVIYSTLMGASVGFALSMHYQSLNLLFLLPLVFVVPKISIGKKVLAFFCAILGFLIVLSPLLIWDLKNDWANTRNLLDYLLIGQHRVYVPNSWRLFLFSYFPTYWSLVLGGSRLVGLFLIFVVGAVFSYETIKRKINPLIFSLGIVFLMLSVLSRYYKGERFGGYQIYLAAFVILFVGWALDEIIGFSFKKRAINYFKNGLVFLFVGILIIANVYHLLPRIKSTNSHLAQLNGVVDKIGKLYPDKKYFIYNFKGNNPDASFALSVLLTDKDKIDKQGVKLGTCMTGACPDDLITVSSLLTSSIVLLSQDDIKNPDWQEVSQEGIYDSNVVWLRNGNLKANFSLWSYIGERF